jgi:hypothetical protein
MHEVAGASKIFVDVNQIAPIILHKIAVQSVEYRIRNITLSLSHTHPLPLPLSLSHTVISLLLNFDAKQSNFMLN